jgi:protein O-GlcNAc transferase
MSQDDFQRADKLVQAGKLAEAIGAYRAGLAGNPNDASGHNNLANALLAAGDKQGAIESFGHALQLNPDSPGILFNLGTALAAARQFDEAIAIFRRALSLHPTLAPLLNNLGNTLTTAGNATEAVPLLRRAVELEPRNAQFILNLANTLRALGQINEPIDLYARSIQIQPDSSSAYNNMGVALIERGELEPGIAAIRKAVQISPNSAAADSNLVFYLQFKEGTSTESLARELARWNDQHAAKFARKTPHANDRNPNRRLRVGYVSPDFRKHCQSFFTAPLLSNHDHQQFEIYCYSSVGNPDATADRLRKYADHWRECVDKSNAEMAEMIAADQIDLLVDLTMHMANGRPTVFARKPAPVQVAWLAYPGSTGLAAMDYRISDPYLDPDGAKYCEQTIQLPETFWCYEPEQDPPVHEAPALRNGFITFGCLNAPRKISDGTLRLWGRVLAEVPNSRLILLVPDGPTRQRVLQKTGTGPDRILFENHQPRREYLETYHRIDIGLDTIPYNGHTTSLDSMWMGVPVITRLGNTVAGRAGWSQLNNLNMTDLAAKTDDEFVKIAADLSHDLPRLTQMRARLRGRMKSSPLMDGMKFARNMESAYRQMWRKWCEAS